MICYERSRGSKGKIIYLKKNFLFLFSDQNLQMHMEKLRFNLCHRSTSEITRSKCTSRVSIKSSFDGFMSFFYRDERLSLSPIAFSHENYIPIGHSNINQNELAHKNCAMHFSLIEGHFCRKNKLLFLPSLSLTLSALLIKLQL
jgi:hypothetical protein